MLYKITNGTLSFGEREVLSHVDFVIKGNEKLALVGANGAGKTTLLRVIAGELELDRDDRRTEPAIWMSRSLRIAMLSQQTDADAGMSGGEQTRQRLEELFAQDVDLLLLDEPTNHLDVKAMEWLEYQLQHYPHAVVMVSHDRYFLDRTADAVYDLTNGHLKRYAGNYTAYREQKHKDIEQQQKAYDRQQEEIHRLEELIERFKHKPRKAAFARSRRTILERMDRIEPPEPDSAHIFTGELVPARPGSKWPVECEQLEIGYDHTLLTVSLRVRRGQKIGILGSNGIGKTTFLKTLAGELPPLTGKLTLGTGDTIGYFDQHTASISSELTVVEHFRERFPGMTEKDLRHTLGSYLFPGAEASKRVNSLSGGEKARLVLAELLTACPQMLLLDEPTNHMDIPAKETLESAFRAYQGTILFVSHDRYFLSHVADAVLIFEKDAIRYDPFGYEHYCEKQRQGIDAQRLPRAEEQAMIAAFEAVPKKERHETAPQSTDEAYVDWQLRLAAEPLAAARTAVETLWNQRETLQGKSEEIYYEKQDALSQSLEEAWDAWTDACLTWFESIGSL